MIWGRFKLSIMEIHYCLTWIGIVLSFLNKGRQGGQTKAPKVTGEFLLGNTLLGITRG